MNAVIKWVVVHVAGWFHSISSADLGHALDLVVKAEKVANTGAEKLKWFAEQMGKVNTSLKLWHEDGSATNTLNLLVSVAKDLAEKFGLIKG
jgi:hypothetical protein